MVDERYTEALANGTALLESGRNIPEAAKCFLKARSWASTDKQRRGFLLGLLGAISNAVGEETIKDRVGKLSTMKVWTTSTPSKRKPHCR